MFYVNQLLTPGIPCKKNLLTGGYLARKECDESKCSMQEVKVIRECRRRVNGFSKWLSYEA